MYLLTSLLITYLLLMFANIRLLQDLVKIIAMGRTFCQHKIEVRSLYRSTALSSDGYLLSG